MADHELREHITDDSGWCWCEPTITYVGPDGIKVYVHHDWDDGLPAQPAIATRRRKPVLN